MLPRHHAHLDPPLCSAHRAPPATSLLLLFYLLLLLLLSRHQDSTLPRGQIYSSSPSRSLCCVSERNSKGLKIARLHGHHIAHHHLWILPDWVGISRVCFLPVDLFSFLPVLSFSFPFFFFILYFIIKCTFTLMISNIYYIKYVLFPIWIILILIL